LKPRKGEVKETNESIWICSWAIGTILLIFVHWIVGFATIILAIILLLVPQKPGSEALKNAPSVLKKLKLKPLSVGFVEQMYQKLFQRVINFVHNADIKSRAICFLSKSNLWL